MSNPQIISGQNIVLNSNNNIFLDATRTIVSHLVNTTNPKLQCALTVKSYTNNTITAADISNGLVIFNLTPNSIPTDLLQNPLSVDSSIFFQTGTDVPLVNNPYIYINNSDVVIPLNLPTDLSSVLKVGESTELTIINNGNSALRLSSNNVNVQTVGFDLIYDATSAKFIVKRETNTTIYFVRSA